MSTTDAGRVRCPVFIGLGERDSTPSHHGEPGAYRSAQDITLFVLPRSAHCHNSAGTRHLLWDRLDHRPAGPVLVSRRAEGTSGVPVRSEP